MNFINGQMKLVNTLLMQLKKGKKEPLSTHALIYYLMQYGSLIEFTNVFATSKLLLRLVIRTEAL